MSGINETLVREFFEARGFLVRQQRKYVASGLPADEIDFVVLNPRRTATVSDLPFVLEGADVDGLATAVVAVRGWHTETFSAALLAQEPEVARFTDAETVTRALGALGLAGRPARRVLVVPSLPQTHAAREAAVAALRERGVDAVLPFRSVLGVLIQHIETNRNYAKSDVLQVLRILKNYDLLKEPSLELFRARPRRREKG